MTLVNGNMEDNYYKSIIKNIGYVYDDLFSKNDVKMIIDNTFFDADEDDIVTHLTEMGHKKGSAAESNYTVWQNLNKQTFHAFEKIYSKLICCLGDKKGEGKEMSLTVPVYDPKKGAVNFVPKIFNIPKKAECSFSGDSYYDDGTPEGYNAKCEYLMQKYCLFLQKYDPKNPLIEKMCGCLLPRKFLSKNVDWSQETNQLALNSIDDNRKCGITQCLKGSYAYKRLSDREPCASNINICTNNVNVSEIEAESAAISNIKLSNNCGGKETPQVPKNEVSVPKETTNVETDNNDGGSDNDKIEYTEPEPEPEPEQSATDSSATDSSATDSSATDSAATPKEELGFFARIMAWFSSLFGGSEGFSPKNNKFDQIYGVFSIIVIYMLIFKDPLKIQKKVQKMF